jgi:carboxyl-terminal processing protease
MRKQASSNQLSLNEASRIAENAANRERNNKRRQESRQRYAKVEEAENSKFTIYEVTLDNVDNENLSLQKDISEQERSGVRVAREDDAETGSGSSDSKNGSKGPLRYPHGFDPTKRETLDILVDFIQMERQGKS